MNEVEYKLNILKDILKFSRRTLTEEEKNVLLSSALFQDKNYFTSAAILVKKGSIIIDDVINLAKLKESELPLFLTPTEDTFDYFAKTTPNGMIEAFIRMDEYIKNNPEEALENKRKNESQIEKIKELHDEMKRKA